jgi:glycosyltransferase involved in cell wall biosynthesis
MTPGRGLISIVFSFRNEAQNIPELIARIERVFASQPEDYEMIFVNDSSSDDSAAVLLSERQRNRRVKILNMSRRFGVVECILAGLSKASGDAVIYMDADLQDPPEVIPQLLEQWRQGVPVVHTVRTRREGESRIKTWFTKQAYRVIRMVSTIELPVEAGDFKLLSHQAVKRLLELPESDPYIRGLVVWMGLPQVAVPYERAARRAGKTHFPVFSRNPWKTLVSALTSFSFMPIYLCGLTALIGLAASAGMFVAAILAELSRPGVGFSLAIFALALFFWATIIGSISAVGVYVIRIYKDVRRRPQYIIESSDGFDP